MSDAASAAKERHKEGDLVRDAFRRRAGQAVERIASSASVEELAQALEAPTDFGAVARALGNGAIPAAAIDLDPLADGIARGANERNTLTQQAGGLLSAEEMGRVLGGISRQAVDKRRRANQLLAIRIAGDWRYPACQIGHDGQVPFLLPDLLKEAAGMGLTGWAMLDFLLAPDTTLGGSSPLAALQGGNAASVGRLLQGMQADAFG